MATVRFTESIERRVQCPTRTIPGSSLRDVLEGQGVLRKHMAIFIDGRQIGIAGADGRDCGE